MITSFAAALVERGGAVDVYKLTATSDEAAPSFYWYREGALVGVTRLGELVVVVPAGAGAAFEVLDDVNGVPEPGVPGTVLLTWAPVSGAVGYVVRDVADPEEPVELGRVSAGSGRLWWESPILPEGVAELQIVPVFERGQEGPARPVVVRVVRRPGAPAFTVAYDAETGELSGTVGV